MKIKISLFLLLFISAVGMNAQGLDGTWKATIQKSGNEADLYFTFKQDSLNLTISTEKGQQEMGTIGLSINVPFSYALNGDKIKVIGDGSGFTVSIDKLQLDETLSVSDEEMQVLKKTLTKALQNNMEATKGDFIKQFIKDDALTIKSRSDSQMIIADDTGEEITFIKCQ